MVWTACEHCHKHPQDACQSASSLLSDDSGTIPSLARATCLQERLGHARMRKNAFEPVLGTRPRHWRLRSLRRFPPCLRSRGHAPHQAGLHWALSSPAHRFGRTHGRLGRGWHVLASRPYEASSLNPESSSALRPTSPAWLRLPRRSRPSHLRAAVGNNRGPLASGSFRKVSVNCSCRNSPLRL